MIRTRHSKGLAHRIYCSCWSGHSHGPGTTSHPSTATLRVRATARSTVLVFSHSDMVRPTSIALPRHTTLKPTSSFIFLRKCPSANVHSPSTWRSVPQAILGSEALLRCPALPCPPHINQNPRREYTVLHSVYLTYCTDPEVHAAPESVLVCQCLGQCRLAKPLPDPSKVPSSLRSAIRRLTCESSTNTKSTRSFTTTLCSKPSVVLSPTACFNYSTRAHQSGSGTLHTQARNVPRSKDNCTSLQSNFKTKTKIFSARSLFVTTT